MGEERKLPFGITSVMPSTMQTIADSKVTGFTIGAQKRSNPFQKHKEEAEMKRRKESEEAAKAYEEFVASFEVDESSKKEKKFIKGKSTFVPTTSVFGEDDEDEVAKDIEAKAKAAYKPQTFSQSTSTKIPSSILGLEPEPTPYVRDAKARRKKEMDAFLEELKRNQAEREERASNRASRQNQDDYKMGSRDNGDLTTTNLYIGNINPTVNEEQLCMEFAKYGPIASIKIMWPRTTEEIERNRNCGFVSFMDRADAAIALKEMDGMELMGYVMKLGWGKAVALPAVPFFVHKDYKAPPKPVKVNVRKSIPPSSTDIIVHKPKDPQTLACIHRVIEKVLVNGHEFEEVLIEKESHNPTFAFLVDHKSQEHIYYRWKLFSMMQGDTAMRWRTEPFKMVDGGPVWVPPLMSFTDEIFEEDERLIEAHEEEFEKSPIKGTLSRGARSFFEAQLRMLTTQRRSIGRAMLFCMRHADAADEIVEIIVGSMVLSGTPQPVRLARLYLISDILHNCSVPLPNVWKFRSSFEQKLPVIFEAFNGIYRNIDARLKAEQFRRQISSVLVIWETWIVFPQAYIDNLANILIRKDPCQQSDSHSSNTVSAAASTSNPEPKSGFSNTFKAVDQNDGNGDEDIDGVPIEDEDIDGVPMKDQDLDGIPMDEDIDGVPLEDEDLDGVPL
ncbi:U2 snRNP-associated SURP domain-containing protein [Mortierella sp. AD011]|nr:U2 snRNP-associated SURP domain-containing protein [Mortierella sp. AD010]KAF9387763.1 U2 snRNP-associated SURP domain-containing protein [Mortierella sp. AD011]